MKCIFCRKEMSDNDVSREHVVPAALGGTLVIREVCKECNSTLGSNIDIGLTENYFINFHISKYGITKHGKPVNPFKNDLYDVDGAKMRMVIDKSTGNFIPQRVHPDIQIRDIAGSNKKEIHCIYSPGQENSCIHDIIKQLERKFHANKELITANLKSVKKISIPYTNELHYTGEINIYELYMAIIKIAYELAYYWLGQEYLESEFSKEISQTLIKKDFKNGIKYIGNAKGHLLHHKSYFISAIMIPKPYTNDLYIVINIFNIFSIPVKIYNNNIFFSKIDIINNMPYILFDCKGKSYTNDTITNTIIGEMNNISNSSYLFDVNS